MSLPPGPRPADQLGSERVALTPTSLLDPLRRVAEGEPGAAELDALKTAVCDYTREMKAAGLLPEQVVVRLRKLAIEAGLHPQSIMHRTSPIDRIVEWCLAEYFPPADR